MWRSAVQVCLGLHFAEGNVAQRLTKVCLGLHFDAESINVFQEVFSETHYGGLAQLARALAWHARGHRFDPDILHYAPRSERSLTY